MTVAFGLVLLAQQADPRAVVEKARASIEAGDYAGAEELYRDSLRTNARDARLWNALGVVLNRQDRFTEAAAAFRSALDLEPKVDGLRLNVGIALFRAGDYAAAAVALQPIAANEQASQLLVLSYAGAKDYPRAIPALEKLAETSADPAIHVALATCYADQKLDSEVERAMARMFRLVPDSAALHVALGQAYERRLDTDRAIDEYRRAAALDPSLPGPRLQAARILADKERFDEAERELLAELKNDGGSAAAKLLLGSIYLSRGHTEQAAAMLRSYLALRPRDANGYSLLGKALLREQDVAAAVKALEAAVSLGSPDANSFYLLSQAYRRAGRNADATKALERYEELSRVPAH